MKNLLFTFFIIVVVLTSGAFAQSGLDPSFGTGGKVSYSVYGTNTTDAVLIQPDDKIIVLGSCYSNAINSAQPFCYRRFNTDGTRDNFGVEWLSIPGWPPGIPYNAYAGAGGAALQRDGKVIFSGFATIGGSEKVMLARLNTDGSLDNTFGVGGYVVTDATANENDRGQEIAVQPDGKIVLVGYAYTSAPVYHQFVIRYNTDGTFDNSFGTGGIARTFMPGGSMVAGSIALQTDGRILTGGLYNLSGNIGRVITRLLADGVPDAGWDGDGIKIISGQPSGGSLVDYRSDGLAVRLDGSIVTLITGGSIGSFNPDGSTDTSFGTNGVTTVSSGGVYGITTTLSGKVITAGGAYSSTPPFGTDVYNNTYQLLPDGTFDPGFGIGGLFSTGRNNIGRRVAVDSKGRKVVAGLQSSNVIPLYQPYFEVMRFATPPVRNVTVSGRVTRPNGTPVKNAVLLLQNGANPPSISRTNPFGYYIFSDIPTGRTYTISYGSKNVIFDERSILVDDEITGLNITSQE
jgi:uncharacterized delta-60 repeat protein